MVTIGTMNLSNSVGEDIRHDIGYDIGNHQHAHPPLQMHTGVVQREDVNASADILVSEILPRREEEKTSSDSTW